MKILAMADIHNREFGKINEDVDVVVVVGDFTNADGVEFAKRVVEKLKENFPDTKILAVTGNMDVKDVLSFLESEGISIHGKTVKVDGITFGGLGGSNPTPFNTPFELSEDEIKSILEKIECDVALIHAPPFGYFDWIAGNSVGSKAVEEWMKEKKPKILVCAHIHEYEGVAKAKDTLIVKLGTVMNGKAAVIDIDENFENVIVRFIKI